MAKQIQTDQLESGGLSPGTSKYYGTDGTSTKGFHDGVDLGLEAIDIPYDNVASGLTATDVQAAIDELEGIVSTPASSRHEIVGSVSLTFDDVAQAQVVINHNLGVAPTKIELIDYGSVFASGSPNMVGSWANNNGTKTSLAVFRDTGDDRLTTANETLVTYDETGSNIGDWRVTSVSSTQVLLDYTIVADGGSFAPVTIICYFLLST